MRYRQTHKIETEVTADTLADAVELFDDHGVEASVEDPVVTTEHEISEVEEVPPSNWPPIETRKLV